jgi:hypothetical protein
MSVNETRSTIVFRITTLIVLAAIVCTGCKRASVTAPPTATETLDPEKEALAKVEQDRGEATGRNAMVKVPDQLTHYANRHRFLAVQAADVHSSTDAISGDFADLVPLIKQHELLELKPVGDDYILYGVGENVSSEPFEHYDPATQQTLPLPSSEQSFKDEVMRAANDVKQSAASLASVANDLKRTPRRDRARRAMLSLELIRARKSLASTKARCQLLSTFYKDPERRRSLLTEYQLLSNFARDFDGRAYDLNSSDDRRLLKIRFLSFIRPEARDVLIQIAQAYKEKFDRPLPISSLVRPVQYQHQLAATNANAARGNSPPHSTGLAFDLYYRYMGAAEQEYLMTVIAKLKDEGRIEALREARDNIHVYVFGNGHRPAEKLIARAIASSSPRERASRRKSIELRASRKRR